jgi:hypothetical protein
MVDLERNFQRCREAVRIFYLLSTLFAATMLLPTHYEARQAAELDLTWPVMWLHGRDFVIWADIFSLAAVVASFVAYLDPGNRIARAVLPASLLVVGGLLSSFGGINHYVHSWFWVALVMVFLPASGRRADKLSYCLTFATAQAMLLGFYSLAGLWKLREGMAALLVAGEGDFAPRGLALTLADRIMQTGTQPLLGRFLVENYWLAWPMFLAVIYMQVVAILVVFRPRLHMAWGLGLLLFHLMTFVAMEIIFTVNVLLILAVLIRSPFQEPGWVSVRTLHDLPLLGFVFRRRSQSIGQVATAG